MKDFDKERHERNAALEARLGERTFVVGGETFIYRSVVSYTVMEGIVQTGELEGSDLVRKMEECLLELIEDGQEERLLKVLHSKEDPLTFADLNGIVEWITEAQSGRPTLAPLLSTAGDATTSTSLTEDSSSPLVAESAA